MAVVHVSVVTAASRIPMAERRIEYVRLSDVPPAFRNPKKHDLPSIIASIHEHGFADAAILDERTQRLVAGHGRTAALVDMRHHGDKMPDGIAIDEDGEWLVPIQRGWSSKSDEHAEAFIITHNRLTEAGGWDDRMLATMLQEVVDAEASAFIGALPHERTEARTTRRNGTREKMERDTEALQGYGLWATFSKDE